jgi:hypothetical protein
MSNKLMIVCKDSRVDAVPLYHDVLTDSIPCTYRNATDRTVYVWHWLVPQSFHLGPCLVEPLGLGQSVTVYYPTKFFVRATSGYDFRSTVLEESTVGDIPRHVLLTAPHHAVAG